MKRLISILFIFIALLLISVFAFSPFASAAVKYTDLSQLDDNQTYTKEDMLAMYDFGYSVGYKEGTAEKSSSSGAPVKAAAASVTSSVIDYVLNTNTNKFHYPSCASVGDIKPENTSYFTGSRDEVIAQGYKPCGRCKP